MALPDRTHIAGHSLTHCVRGVLTYCRIDSWVWYLTEAFIRASTSPSQTSTFPSGYIDLSNGTVSPSRDVMAVISSVFSLISSDMTASKHFRRWGWTARGFFVCERICSSSSFERKKNRENASRLVSR